MPYSLSLGAWNTVFAVPTALVDQQLRLASGNQLKVILFFLRHAGEVLDPEALAGQLRLSPAEVTEALDYWTHAGILAKNENMLFPSAKTQTQPKAKTAADPKPEITVHTQPEQVLPPTRSKSTLPPLPGTQELKDYIQSDKDFPALSQNAERILGRRLTSQHIKLLFWSRELLALPDDVICMLLYSCKAAEKTDPAFLYETAASWWMKEINTHAAAEHYLSALEKSRQTEARLRKLLEWDKSFTPNQLKSIALWTEQWAFSDEVIGMAYHAARDAEVQRVFPYMQSMLSRWHDEHLTTPKEILAADELFRKNRTAKKGTGKKPKKETSYQMAEIHKLLDDLPDTGQ